MDSDNGNVDDRQLIIIHFKMKNKSKFWQRLFLFFEINMRFFSNHEFLKKKITSLSRAFVVPCYCCHIFENDLTYFFNL